MGCIRSDQQGIKIANWIAKKLKEIGHEVFLADPVELKLPLLDKMYEELDPLSENLKKLCNITSKPDGYIPVTPVYNHSILSAMENNLNYYWKNIFSNYLPLVRILQRLLMEFLLIII